MNASLVESLWKQPFHAERSREFLAGFAEAIEQTLHDSERLDSLVRRSYRHPNGFEKIILQPSVDRGEELRVHYWNTDSRDANVHSHAWEFVSYVLRGALRNSLYSIAPGDEYMAYITSPVLLNDTAASAYELSEAGRVRLEPIGCFELPPHTFYRMNCDVFHEIQPSEDAISLVVQSAFRRQSSVVVAKERPLAAGAVLCGIEERRCESLLLTTLSEIKRTLAND